MVRAEVIVRQDGTDNEISPLIYGQYLEHVDDCIYPAVCDPGSPVSDARGLREDVQDVATELGVPVVRWPGGCFADVYHWQDGVGPSAQRPLRRNWHWGGTESNQFGTDEFLSWCERIGAEPYLNLNLGTGTLDEALRWLDYCLGTRETAEVRARMAGGRREPYRVELCGIGNETWASWEAGAFDTHGYARTLANWADFVRRYAPNTSVLGVGSQEGADPAWDRAVLDAAGEHLNYLTNHLYGYSVDRVSGAEYFGIVFTPVYVEARLRAMADVLATYQRGGRSAPVRIALDEWNIRHYQEDGAGGFELNRSSPRTVQDAIFVAGVLNAMIRMAPVVGMANYVFLVNGNGVLNVRGDRLVKTTLYHVFQRYRQWMRGMRLDVDVRCPSIVTPNPYADRPGYIPELGGLPPRSNYLDVAAAQDGERISLALVNRHPTEPLTVSMTGAGTLRESWTLTHDDVYAVNDFDTPERVVPREGWVDPGTSTWQCPPHSVTLLRGTVGGEGAL